MICSILPSLAKGQCEAPKSKSMAHRLAILSAFAEGVSHIRGFAMCEDTEATLCCLKALGVPFSNENGVLCVQGKGGPSVSVNAPLYVNLSASTLRFFIPLALLFRCEMEFIGEKSLFQRPLTVYKQLFSSLSCPFVLRETSLYVDTRGLNTFPKTMEVDASISSQFITGLLFLYALSGGGSITLLGEIGSRPYIDLTLYALSLYGVKAYFEGERTIVIPEGQRLLGADIEVEGDYSASAFLEALNLLGGEVKVSSLNENSLQGDRIYRKLFSELSLGAPTIDINTCPDLAPILMTLASFLNGATLLSTDRLKLKESDRGVCMAEELEKFGADICVGENTIVIKKAPLHAPKEVLCGHSDHRIVMSLALLLTKYGGQISDCEAVKKSYPNFFSDLEKMGIQIHCS